MNPDTGIDGPDEDLVDTDARLADSRMECRICWYLYDPSEGDPVGQVPPETAFDDLPDNWRCPRCDSDTSFFLPSPDSIAPANQPRRG